MKRYTLALPIVAALAAFASDADAQTNSWRNLDYVSLNGLYQSTPINFTTDAKMDLYQETGDVRTGHRIEPGPVYDVTAGGKVRGRLGISYTLSYRKQTETGEVTANVPHPFYYNQSRLVAGDTRLNHEDLAFHVAARWPVPVSNAIQLSLFGGPSFFRVTQDMVSNVEVRESFPFDQAEYAGASVAAEHASRLGFNAGADAAYYFTRSIGVGGLVRFSQARVNMPLPDGNKASVKAGGVQVGGGLRLRF